MLKFKNPKTIVLGGGVSANTVLRQTLKEKIQIKNSALKFYLPDLNFTGDNASMIAVAGYFHYQAGQLVDPSQIMANSSLRLS